MWWGGGWGGGDGGFGFLNEEVGFGWGDWGGGILCSNKVGEVGCVLGGVWWGVYFGLGGEDERGSLVGKLEWGGGLEVVCGVLG
uniref:Uncharacterized protein n=1 Tax=Knipowitschia caucasica TaxID=637954 RepID=A0AAV2K665_KNICA